MQLSHTSSTVSLDIFLGSAFCSYLFVFSIDVHFLGADGLADVVDVIFSAVVKDVLILFPESDAKIEKKKEKERKKIQLNLFLDHQELTLIWFYLAKYLQSVGHFFHNTIG